MIIAQLCMKFVGDTFMHSNNYLYLAT